MHKNPDDPLEKQPEAGECGSGLSPMDPPDAYEPPSVEKVDLETLHPFLRSLIEEHTAVDETIASFERALLAFQADGPSKQAHADIRNFFHAFDHEIAPHNRLEERALFPLLHRRLIEVGEYGQGEEKTTAITVLEDDHTTALQLAAVVFNFFGVVSRLPDESSRLLVLDAAIEQGKTLVELLKLHIFRENEIVIPLAAKHLSTAELDEVEANSRR